MVQWTNFATGQLYAFLARLLNHPNSELLPHRHPSTHGNGVHFLNGLRFEAIIRAKTLTCLAA